MLDAPTYFFGAPPELLGLTTPAISTGNAYLILGMDATI